MKKFWHITYIVVMRILFFILLLALCPLWVLFGILFAFYLLLGFADDIFDPDYCDSGEYKGNGCPEYVEKVDKLENNTEIPTDN